jgi:hypothetical protein
MATLNLSELEANAEVITPVADSSSTGISTRNTFAGLHGIDADLEMSDIRIPRINLVQKSSELAEVEGWSPGDFAFAKEIKLIPFGQSGKVTFIRLKRQYQEALPYGSSETPKVFNTKEEVLAAGGSLNFQAPNEYRPIAHLTMLIEQPPVPEGENDAAIESYFPISFGGKNYSMAVWTVSSTSYKSVVVELLSAATLFMRDGLHKAAWNLSVEKAKSKSGTNTYFVAKIKRAGAHSPEMVEFIESLL